MGNHKHRTAAVIHPLEPRLLLAAGDLDPDFGTGGVRVHPASAPPLAMALQPGGKILVATADNHLERFTPTGDRDTTFGDAGRVDVAFHIAGLAVAPDGQIILGGSNSPASGATNWYVARLNPDGSPDATFNGGDADYPNDYRVAPPTHFAGTRADAQWFALQPDGKVLLGGILNRGPSPDPYPPHDLTDLNLLRFNADGTPDTSFGQAGEVATDNGNWTSGGATFVRADGTIVVAGNTSGWMYSWAYQTVFDGAGHFLREGSFGPSDGGWPSNHFGAAAALRPDGALLLTTSSALVLDGNTLPFAFNTALDLVPFRSAPRTPPAFGGISAAAATPDNKFLLATGGKTIALARLNPDGSPDLSFGFGGTTALHLDPADDGWVGTQTVAALAATPDGDVLAAGNFRGRLFLARFEGGAHPITHTPPAAALAAGYADYNHRLTVTVRYFGDRPIDPATIDLDDVTVTGPNGFTASPDAFLDLRGTTAPLEVSYEFHVGDADLPDGTYTVHLRPGEVADALGTPVPELTVGAFDYRSSTYTPAAPDDTPFVAHILSPVGPRADRTRVTFQVRFDAAAGVDLASLGDTNFRVVRREDDSFINAHFVSAQSADNGRTVVATYRFAPPGAAWSAGGDAPSEGNYAIVVDQSPVDRAGHTFARTNGDDADAIGNFSFHPGAAQPSAALESVTSPTPGKLEIRVRFTGDIDLTSIDERAVAVRPIDAPPPAWPTWASLTRTERQSDGTLLADYTASVDPQGRAFAVALAAPDHETYPAEKTFGPRARDGTPLPAGLLGTIDLAPPARPPNDDRTAPTAAVDAADGLRAPLEYFEFTVTYHDDRRVAAETIDDGDLLVSGPGRFLARATLVDQRRARNRNTRVATYRVAGPFYQGWTRAANGSYTVHLQAGEVTDTGGNAARDRRIGAFTVDIPAGPPNLDHYPRYPGDVASATPAVVGDKAVFAGGGSATVFDSTAAAWTAGAWTTAPLSDQRTQIGAAVVGHTAVFAGGTLGGGHLSTAVVLYDADTDTWSDAPPLPDPRRNLRGVAVGTKAFFVGGRDDQSNLVNTGYLYDTATNAWTTFTPPTGCSTAAVVGTKAIFTGGRYYSPRLGRFRLDTTALVYDDATGQWTTTQLPPATAPDNPNTATIALGLARQAVFVRSNSLRVYDDATAAWSTVVTDLEEPTAATAAGTTVLVTNGDATVAYDTVTHRLTRHRISQTRNGPVAATLGTLAFFAGGYYTDATGQYRSSDIVDVYDTATDIWYATTLTDPRAELNPATIGKHLLLAGGWDYATASPSSTVDLFTQY